MFSMSPDVDHKTEAFSIGHTSLEQFKPGDLNVGAYVAKSSSLSTEPWCLKCYSLSSIIHPPILGKFQLCPHSSQRDLNVLFREKSEDSLQTVSTVNIGRHQSSFLLQVCVLMF